MTRVKLHRLSGMAIFIISSIRQARMPKMRLLIFRAILPLTMRCRMRKLSWLLTRSRILMTLLHRMRMGTAIIPGVSM